MSVTSKTVFATCLGFALLATSTASATFYNTGTKYNTVTQQKQSAPAPVFTAQDRAQLEALASQFIQTSSAQKSGASKTLTAPAASTQLTVRPGASQDLKSFVNNTLSGSTISSGNFGNLFSGGISGLQAISGQIEAKQGGGGIFSSSGGFSSSSSGVSSSSGGIFSSSGGFSSSSGGFSSSSGGFSSSSGSFSSSSSGVSSSSGGIFSSSGGFSSTSGGFSSSSSGVSSSSGGIFSSSGGFSSTSGGFSSSSSGGFSSSSSGVTSSSSGVTSSSGGSGSSGGFASSSSGGGQVPVPGPLSFLIAAAGLFMLRRNKAA